MTPTGLRPRRRRRKEASDARLSDHLGSCVFPERLDKKKTVTLLGRREKKEKKTACFMRLFVQDS